MNVYKIHKKLQNILTKKFLIKEYIKNKKNPQEIANFIKCSLSTIRNRLIKFNIPIRTISQVAFERYKNPRNNPNYTDGRSIKLPHCIDCGKELKNYRAKRCKQHRKYLSGKNASNYINGKGYEPYSSEFTSKLKESIRKRDNYTCQGENCRMTEEEHIIVYGRVLEAHHIDYDKENCKENNLITVCKQCNIRANYNREYWKEYFTKGLYHV